MGLKRTARRATALAAILVLVGTAQAQETQFIEPGMGADQVKLVFGEPQGISSYGQFTFYFYDNACEKECGFPDIVFIQNGQVADAVLRAPWRGYNGESSSPKGVIPRSTPGGERLQVPAAVEGVEVRPAQVPVPQPLEERTDTAKADTSAVRG